MVKKPDVWADIPVLIVGGGPVGLSASILLSDHGIRSMLVDQHPGTSTDPKARLINARTMEVFRQAGIENAVAALDIPHARNIVVARRLAGEELFRGPMEKVVSEVLQAWSPSCGCTTAQDILEPVLLGHAQRRAPAQVRFSTQLASFVQHNDHVLATLVHRPTGRVQQVRAQYLIGADGSRSAVRESLGIRMLGQPFLTYHVNILFRADLSPWVAGREINMCIITDPDGPGQLYFYGGHRWRFSATYDPSRGQRPEDFTPDRCLQLVRLAVGAPELDVQLLDIVPWHDSELVAERFHDRRVFLVGDAVHLMSPAGGFGMNVGIQDAHNLAWKLAAVISGWAPPASLASYEAERRPVALSMVDQMARNMRSRIAPDPYAVHSSASPDAPHPPMDRADVGREHNLVFGVTYDSPLIVSDGTSPLQVANPVTDYSPSARPGSRAPHVWLDRNGERLSTLDLFGRGFVLLTGSSGEAWRAAARQSPGRSVVPLLAFAIGPDGDFTCPDGLLSAKYGIDEDGAVLVRPDGYVAWRSRSGVSDPGRVLDQAIATAVGFPVAADASVTVSG